MRRGEGAGMLFLFDAVPYREWQVNRFTTPLRARLEELRTITDGISSPFVDYLHHAPVTAEEVPHVARIAYANGMAGLGGKAAASVYVRGRSPRSEERRVGHGGGVRGDLGGTRISKKKKTTYK